MHRIINSPELRLVGGGFLLNVVWEFAQSPLYADHRNGTLYILWSRLHCTVGDVMILLACYWLISLVFFDRNWPRTNRIWPPAILFVLAGVGYTLFSEWYNTQVQLSWSYAGPMPVVLGIGLTPILQWLILPPLLVLLLRRCLARQNKSQDATNDHLR